MRARFVTLNLMGAAVILAAWRTGYFEPVSTFGWHELAMLGALCLYGSVGFGAIFFERWDLARHIANGTPMFALGCTGVGMLLAVSGLHSLTPEAMATVFRELAFAIAPNVLGVLVMAWLRELVWWCGHVEV